MIRLFSIPAGLACLGMVWLLRPRFGKPPEKHVVNREDAPALHNLIDEIAKSLGASQIDYLVIGPDFNAAFGWASFLRKRVFHLGLPLLETMNDEEMIALIGHELAHDINGDAARGRFISPAISSFVGWYAMWRPRYIWHPSMGPVGFLVTPVALFLFIASGFGWIGAYVLVHLLFRDSQRAEYLADRLAATVGGTQAALNMLEKLNYAGSFFTILQRVTLSPELHRENLFALLRERTETTPPQEIERIRRIQQLEQSRLDVTHPPTPYRIAALQAHPISEADVTLDAAESTAIRQELAALEPALQEKLIDLRRAGYFVAY